MTSTRPVLEADCAAWKAFVGKRKVQHAVADADILHRFALAADIDADVERQVPALSHWALFFDAVADERIGEDGHPRRGDFLPDVHLPRRMFASSELAFHQALTLGEPAQCVSTITSVSHKGGRSGDLVFVNVQREITQRTNLCVVELQTLVYRAAGAPLDPVEEGDPATGEYEVWKPGPVELFRFSAVTFNAHRIHYDLPYAQLEEGYPGLVLQGPFTAVKLLDYACRNANRAANRFAFRGVAPLFASQPIYLSAGAGSGEYLAKRCDGVVAMMAKAEFQ